MPDDLTTSAVAEKLDVPASTIKRWSEQFPVNAYKDDRGRMRFKPDSVRVLEIIKSLRDEDRGPATITRLVSSEWAAIGPETGPSSIPVQSQTEPGSSQPTAAPSMDAGSLVEQITAAVTMAIRTDNELAEKYARATFEIGTLQERVAQLQEREQRLLTSGQDQDAEIERLRAELVDRSRLTADIEFELRAERARQARPWWRRLTGG